MYFLKGKAYFLYNNAYLIIINKNGRSKSIAKF